VYFVTLGHIAAFPDAIETPECSFVEDEVLEMNKYDLH
jgi:hypothetical protein